MQDRDYFLTESFEHEDELIILFGIKFFYHKFDLYYPLFDNNNEDNLFLNLMKTITFFLGKKINQNQSIANITKIIESSLNYSHFQHGCKVIKEKFDNQQQNLVYLWELGSDMVHFALEYLNFLKNSLAIIGENNDSFSKFIIEVNSYLAILTANKPDNARETKKRPIDLTNPQTANEFTIFVRSQIAKSPKCVECNEIAQYFAYPCSHPLYCEECKDDSEKICPKCNRPIEEIIYIP